MSQEKKQKNQVKQSKGWNWKLLPLQFVLCLLPLVLYLYTASSGYGVYPWHSVDDYYSDVFLHGKMIVFTVAAAVALGLAIYKIIKMDREQRRSSLICFLPMFVYMLFVILSTICSENLTYSVFGSMDAKEPVGVLLGYAIVAFYAFVAIDSMDDVNQITTAGVIGGTLMALVGVLQTIGKDPLLNEGIQRLFAGSKFINTYGPLQLNFPVGQAYGTLFNPNYVGTYVAMYVPLVLIGFVMNKKLWKKIVCGLTLVGLLVMLFASQSRTGLIAVVAVAVVMALFLGRKIWKYWYLIIPGVTFVVMAFSLLDTYRDNLLTNRLKQMFAIEKSSDPVLGVDTTGNGVRVVCEDTEYTVMMPVSSSGFAYVAFEGDEQKEVTYDENATYGYFTLNNGEVVAIQTAAYEDRYAFGLVINGRNFYFTNQIVAGNYKYISEYGRLDECIMADNLFYGYEAVASGRGYVWGRSIPLLLSNFIVGSGPDTFGIEFPQNDYVARYKSGFDNIIFTRPHNFYLQMGVQTGTISLIAFLVFYVIYVVASCRRYGFQKYESMEEWMGFAVFLSTVGFMASGFANDSLIVVTPIFYVLIGMGMAINHKLCPVKRKEEQTEEPVEEALEEKNEEEGLE